MQAQFDRFFSTRSRGQVAAISGILVCVVGVVDRVTSGELSFSIFYLAPVAIAAWYAGRLLGNGICGMAAIVWLWADYYAGNTYSHIAIPIWNSGVRLGFFLTVASLLVQLQAALAQQTALARIDGLTGISNGWAFRDRYEELARLAVRHGRVLAFGYLDVDGFKGINDTLGHHVGDRVLQVIATTLVKRLRQSDLVGRLGGDEFAIVLPETDRAGAEKLFADARAALTEVAARESWAIGFSIGAIVFHVPPIAADEALRLADALMYDAKKAGKRAGKDGTILKEMGDPIDPINTVRNAGHRAKRS